MSLIDFAVSAAVNSVCNEKPYIYGENRSTSDPLNDTSQTKVTFSPDSSQKSASRSLAPLNVRSLSTVWEDRRLSLPVPQRQAPVHSAPSGRERSVSCRKKRASALMAKSSEVPPQIGNQVSFVKSCSYCKCIFDFVILIEVVEIGYIFLQIYYRVPVTGGDAL